MKRKALLLAVSQNHLTKERWLGEDDVAKHFISPRLCRSASRSAPWADFVFLGLGSPKMSRSERRPRNRGASPPSPGKSSPHRTQFRGDQRQNAFSYKALWYKGVVYTGRRLFWPEV
jgi:hypothetical protein